MAEAFDPRQEQYAASDKELEQVLRPRQFGEFAGQRTVTVSYTHLTLPTSDLV